MFCPNSFKGKRKSQQRLSCMISCDTKYLLKMYSTANKDEGGVISSVIDNLAPVVANGGTRGHMRPPC